MPSFQPLSLWHWLVIGATGWAIVGVVAAAPGLRRSQQEPWLRGILLVLLGLTITVGWGVALMRGEARLPCQLCDLALLLMIWALAGGPRAVKELAFFWGLAGSSQAILTPDLQEGCPSLRCLTFFSGHCAVVIAAVYLAARTRLALTTQDVWRVWAVSNVYVGVAGALNWIFGTNYGYLARTPAHPSLLDYLGPWPWYVISLEVLAWGLFAGCVAASRALDHWVGDGRAA